MELRSGIQGHQVNIVEDPNATPWFHKTWTRKYDSFSNKGDGVQLMEWFIAAQELDRCAVAKNHVRMLQKVAAVISQVQEFDAVKEDWPQYVEWLEQFFIANDI